MITKLKIKEKQKMFLRSQFLGILHSVQDFKNNIMWLELLFMKDVKLISASEHI